MYFIHMYEYKSLLFMPAPYIDVIYIYIYIYIYIIYMLLIAYYFAQTVLVRCKSHDSTPPDFHGTRSIIRMCRGRGQSCKLGAKSEMYESAVMNTPCDCHVMSAYMHVSPVLESTIRCRHPSRDHAQGHVMHRTRPCAVEREACAFSVTSRPRKL
jgi:hypothetical protein